jgi:hypothetical protein
MHNPQWILQSHEVKRMLITRISSQVRTSDHRAYKYVRVRGFRFQARLRFGKGEKCMPHRRGRTRHGPDNDCNLGLYNSSREAWKAISAVLARLNTRDPITLETIWAATLLAIDAGLVRPNVLPKYVRKHEDGGYIGRLARGGKVWLTDVFADPLDAHREARRIRNRLASQA